MAKTLDQLINPARAPLISAFLSVSAMSDKDRLGIMLMSKVYALKATGGTDYTTNANQLFIDSAHAPMGQSTDELWATRINVWIQAMDATISRSITSSRPPPVSASEAMALSTQFRIRTAYEILRAEVYLDGLLVQGLFAPGAASVPGGIPHAPVIAGFASDNSTPNNSAAYWVHVTPASTPDTNGFITVYYGASQGSGTRKVGVFDVASLVIYVNVSPYNGKHIWAVQTGGGTDFAGISPISATDVTVTP